MSAEQKSVLDFIEGMAPANPEALAALADFQRAMSEEVIPKVVEVVEERRLAAAESRNWQLKC